MLQLKDLNIGYRQKHVNKRVLGPLNLTVESGSLVALAGNNGTGKSTLVKTLSGILLPLSGEIFFNGKNISYFDNLELSKLVSVVLTEKMGGFNLKAFDIVAAGRIPALNAFGKLSKNDITIVNESMSLIGVENLSNALFEELSDGQKQKILIAKSLAQQTPVILMDEPTAFLDYRSRKSLFELLDQLAKTNKKTIIISSHDLEVLFKHAKQTLYLKEDKTYFFGETKDIKDEILTS